MQVAEQSMGEEIANSVSHGLGFLAVQLVAQRLAVDERLVPHKGAATCVQDLQQEMIDREHIEALVAGEPTPRRRYEHIQVRVPRRILRRFRELMPMRGSLSWFIREALQAFVREMEDTPQDTVADTVKRLRADLMQGRTLRMVLGEMEKED